MVFPVHAQDEAVIVGWNILGVDPIPDGRIAKIAETILRIDPDLIVLTEVNPDDAPARIVDHLGDDYAPPIILEQNEDVVQNIALIFKDSVSVTDPQLIQGSDLEEEPRSRKALTAKVRIGEFDFILIGVHLKSSRDTASRNKRTRQCEVIAEFIDEAVAGDEKDVLVIGDYNMIPRRGNVRNDEANFFALSPNNFLRFVSSDFLNDVTLRPSHIDRCNPLRGNLLDGYAISRRFTREYVGSSTRILSFNELGRDCQTFLDEVSDHLPVVSRFRIDRPDDD
jgi:endonuclease/exonuclease/phosphatase family metal-dependent hydrolase